MTSGWQQFGNQVQRPQVSRRVSADRMVVRVFTSSTSNAGTMGVDHDNHHRGQQQNEHLNGPEERPQDPSYGFTDEVRQLRDENATFRHENDLLRTQLVEKMRGQSKVVAGGQFRAASASKVPAAPNSVCTKCVTARAKAIKVHQDCEQAQVATAELQKYVDKVETRQQQLWEERNTHIAEIARLRDKLAEKVEECLLNEAECTKLDKQVRMLQNQNELDETLLVDKDEVVDAAIQCSLERSCDDEVKAAQLREIVTLTSKVQLLFKEINDREFEMKKVVSDLEESQRMALVQKEQRNRESKLRLGEESEHKRRIVELERSMSSAQALLEDLKRTHQQELQLIHETNQQLRNNVSAQEGELQALRQQHRSETSTRELQNQMLVKALKERIEQKMADIKRFRALVEKQAAEIAANNTLKKQVDDLECHVQKLIEEKSQLAEDSALQLQQTEEFARSEYDKLQQEASAEKQRLSEALHLAEQHNRSIQTRVSEVENELAEQGSIMYKQKRSHARALERLIESSLRLCVVAPTVNVQLNTNGSNLAKKISNASTDKVSTEKEPEGLVSVICRSTPQQDSIKRVIENDVLPLFTSVFMQGDDNVSPQGNVPMISWLQDLLHDMQARIAAQLESIYSTASVKSSE